LDLEDASHSLFAYYLIEGLGGRADGYNDQEKRDGRVSAYELAAFVRARVDRWAQSNRDTRQTPLLHGSAGDFPLVGYREQEAVEPEPLAPELYPDWLRAGWVFLDEWRRKSGDRVPLETYRHLEVTLLQAEAHWRGGTDPVRIKTVLQSAMDRFKRQRDEIAALGKVEPRSLAQAVAQGWKLPDLAEGDTLFRFRDLAELDARAQNVKPDDKEKEKLAKDKEKLVAGQKEFLKKFEGKPLELAWTLYEATANEPTLRPEHLRCANDLLTQFANLKPVADPFPYAEVRFLRRVTGWAAAVKENWPGDAVHEALQTFREA
jgi:hypothetical protein